MPAATVSPRQLALLRQLATGDLDNGQYDRRTGHALVRRGLAVYFNRYNGDTRPAVWACLRVTRAGHTFVAQHARESR